MIVLVRELFFVIAKTIVNVACVIVVFHKIGVVIQGVIVMLFNFDINVVDLIPRRKTRHETTTHSKLVV